MDNMENFALSNFLTDLDSNDAVHVTDQQDKAATAFSGEEITTNDEMMDKSVSQNAAQAGGEMVHSMTRSQSDSPSLQSTQTSGSTATPPSSVALSSDGEISNGDLLKWTWATLFQIWTNPSQHPDTADKFRPTIMIAIQGKMWAAMNGWIRYPNETEIELVHRSLPLTSTLWRFLIDARSELGTWDWKDAVLKPWTFTSPQEMSEGVTIFEQKTEAVRDKKDITRQCRPCADGETCENPFHSVSESVCFHWKSWCFYHDHKDDDERRDCLDMLGAELQHVPEYKLEMRTPDAISTKASLLFHKKISSINASPLVHKTKFITCEKFQHNQLDLDATRARIEASEEYKALQASAMGTTRKRKAAKESEKDKTERKPSHGRHDRVSHAFIAPAEQSADFDNSLVSPRTQPQAMPSTLPPMVPRAMDNSRLPEAMPSTLSPMALQAAGNRRTPTSLPPRAMSAEDNVNNGAQACQSEERPSQHIPTYGQHVSIHEQHVPTYGQFVATYRQHAHVYGAHALPPPDPRSEPSPMPSWGNASIPAMHAPVPHHNPQYASMTGAPTYWPAQLPYHPPHRQL